MKNIYRFIYEDWLDCFRWITGRRRVLWIENQNWAGIDWSRVFHAHRYLRYLYRLTAISLPQIFENAECPEIPAITAANYRDISWRSLKLWELSKTGVLASLEMPCMPPEIDSRCLRVLEHYYRKSAHLIDASHAVLRKNRPDTIIVTQGCTPMSRPMVEVARSLGINVVATEGAFLCDYFFCDNATGMIVNRHGFSRLVGDWLPAHELTEEDRRAFRLQLVREQQRKRSEHQTGNCDSTAMVRELLGIPEGKKIAVFIGQVLTDASQTMDSPVFPDPAVLIERVCDIFKELPDWFLVVRLHPKEVDGCSWANEPSNGFGPPEGEPVGLLPYRNATYRRVLAQGITDIPGRLKIVCDKSVNTSHLMEEASLGITANSQAGFEMALKYKPVVVCGDAFYRSKGFTWDVSHEAGLEGVVLAATKCGALSDEQMLAIDSFGCYFVNEFLFPRSFDGAWRRFFQVIDGGPSVGLRRIGLSAVTDRLASHTSRFDESSGN
jgi:hypothetical protein